MDRLSRREEEAFQAIKEYFRDNGYPPTNRELGEMLGIASSSTAHRYLDKLEKKGYIKRTESTPRGIKILKEDHIYG